MDQQAHFAKFRLDLPRSPHIPRELVPALRKIANAVHDQERTYEWLAASDLHHLCQAAGLTIPSETLGAMFQRLFKREARILVDKYEIHMAAQDVQPDKGEGLMEPITAFA